MANEVKKILEHYLFKNGDNLAFSVDLFGVSQDECHEILRNWHPFERPDIYSTYKMPYTVLSISNMTLIDTGEKEAKVAKSSTA